MAIPTALDSKLATIDDLAAAVSTALRTLRHCPPHDPKPVRQRLQAYADAVIEAANEIIASV